MACDLGEKREVHRQLTDESVSFLLISYEFNAFRCLTFFSLSDFEADPLAL